MENRNEKIFLVNKPKGISSFDVIRILRKKLKTGKIGHAGTLDPLASGLLIVGVGEGTRKLKDFISLPKTYMMDILLGKKTDTGDLDGKVIEEKRIGAVSLRKIAKVLNGLIGEVELPAPAYSALKYKGKPFYYYARRGIKIPERRRKTKIYQMKILGVRKTKAGWILRVEMRCGSGTYARSVAEEIGRRLGAPAVLVDLYRTSIGEFGVKDALAPESFMLKTNN